MPEVSSRLRGAGSSRVGFMRTECAEIAPGAKTDPERDSGAALIDGSEARESG